MKKLLIVTSRGNISNFGILYTQKNKEIGKKKGKCVKFIKYIQMLDSKVLINNEDFNPIVVLLDSNSLI